MDMMVLAVAGKVSSGIVLIAPLAAAAALLLWVKMTRLASHNPRKPQKFKDQDNHRGPEQGGYYRYTPGSYSHSYAPGESKYNDENR